MSKQKIPIVHGKSFLLMIFYFLIYILFIFDKVYFFSFLCLLSSNLRNGNAKQVSSKYLRVITCFTEYINTKLYNCFKLYYLLNIIYYIEI